MESENESDDDSNLIEIDPEDGLLQDVVVGFMLA